MEPGAVGQKSPPCHLRGRERGGAAPGAPMISGRGASNVEAIAEPDDSVPYFSVCTHGHGIPTLSIALSIVPGFLQAYAVAH
jgi:hypothetical protein